MVRLQAGGACIYTRDETRRGEQNKLFVHNQWRILTLELLSIRQGEMQPMDCISVLALDYHW